MGRDRGHPRPLLITSKCFLNSFPDPNNNVHLLLSAELPPTPTDSRRLLFNYDNGLSKSSVYLSHRVLTSSSGQPEERRAACDCRISSLSSLSLISVNVDGFVRSMEIRSVTTDVNSPRTSPTVITWLSQIFSRSRGFQFFRMIEPRR